MKCTYSVPSVGGRYRVYKCYLCRVIEETVEVRVGMVDRIRKGDEEAMKAVRRGISAGQQGRFKAVRRWSK